MKTDTTDSLKTEIKILIMETLNITDVNPDDVDDDAPLFGGNNALTLDSVDGIEIIMAIQRRYHIRINDQNLARNIIRSINSIEEFITHETRKN